MPSGDSLSSPDNPRMRADSVETQIAVGGVNRADFGLLSDDAVDEHTRLEQKIFAHAPASAAKFEVQGNEMMLDRVHGFHQFAERLTDKDGEGPASATKIRDHLVLGDLAEWQRPGLFRGNIGRL